MSHVPNPGRPVRLLDRHWAWLQAQPSGPDASLRRLVEAASRDVDGRYRRATAKEECYFYMRDAAGDRPHFEDAARALFADDADALHRCIAAWPDSIRARIAALLDDTGGVP